MNKLKILFVPIIMLWLCSVTAAPVLLDRIVVIVNDSVITQHQINQGIAAAKQELAQSNTPIPPAKALRQQVTNNLINNELLRQLANNAGIKVSDSELNEAIANIAKHNNMTLGQLKDNIEASGLSYAQYRKQFRAQMQISKVQQAAVAAKVKVTDAEVNTFMKKYKNVRNPNAEYHLADILVELPNNPTSQQIQQTEQKAKDLVAQINQGKSFSELAAAHSSGSQALKGGDLGWRHLAEMPAIFADKVQNMKQGQVVGPLRAPNGFHIIKLINVRHSKETLTRNKVRSLIFRRKFEQQLQIWLRQIRDEAYVQFV